MDERDRPRSERWLRPFQEFVRAESFGGILLLTATVAALVWANSPWGGSYDAFWHTPLAIGFGEVGLSKSLLHWINDGLMAIFFFVVGLEIKRELLIGELSSPRKAALPVAAAVGGMVVPALLFTGLNFGGEGVRGWGIPMATDIAFALGILSLLGPRVSVSLKILLTALAIVDDIGAVLVIALFYTDSIAWSYLANAAVLLLVLVAFNRVGVRRPGAYLLVGVLVWYAFLKSGVHATVAGVLVAATIPASVRLDELGFTAEIERSLAAFRAVTSPGPGMNPEQRHRIHEIERTCEQAESPLLRLEHGLHPWVSYAIMPIFALANAGVAVQGGASALGHPVALGIIVGLVSGKLLGVSLFAWVAVRAGWAEKAPEVSWREIVGVAALAGIGFTMSLFIASLAFGEGPLLATAKMGILTASLLAALLGAGLLTRAR